MITLIAAMDSKNGIGIGHFLPWKLPNDLNHFKYTTIGSPVVMGRKTFESIGKPLPGRRNIVMSTDTEYAADGVEVVDSLFDLLKMFPNIKTNNQEVFIIGGATLYSLFMPLAIKLVITHVEGDFMADTFFPEIYPSNWKLVSADAGKRDEDNKYNHVFKYYLRTPSF